MADKVRASKGNCYIDICIGNAGVGICLAEINKTAGYV